MVLPFTSDTVPTVLLSTLGKHFLRCHQKFLQTFRGMSKKVNVTPVPDLPLPFQKQIVFHILLWFGAYARYFAEQKLVLVSGRVPHPICYCDFPPSPKSLPFGVICPRRTKRTWRAIYSQESNHWDTSGFSGLCSAGCSYQTW